MGALHALFVDESVALYHSIAYTDFGEYILWFCGVCLKLAADICHIHAQNLVVVRGVGSPELFYEKIVG